MLHLSLGYGKIKPQKQLRPLAFCSLGLHDQIVSHMYQNEFGWSNHGQTTFHTLYLHRLAQVLISRLNCNLTDSRLVIKNLAGCINCSYLFEAEV